MHTRAFLAAVIGLSFVAPAAPLAAQSANDFLNLRIAQADRSREEGAGQKAGPRDSGRGDARDRGSDRSRDAGRNAGKDADSARREAEAKAKAAREAAAKARAEQQAKSRAEAETRAKAAREAAEKARGAEQQAKSRAEAEARAKAAREAAQKAKAEQQAKSRADDRERDRRERASDRWRRGGEQEREARERAQRREQQRTPAQELSKVQVRPDHRVTIDGGRRTLERHGDRVVIRTNDTTRFIARGNHRGNERVERLPNGQTRTIVVYPDGTQIITITDARGAVVHRSRRGRDGREVVFFREVNRPPLVHVNLGPLHVSIPREQYIVDSRRASRADLQRVFWARPVEPVQRIYTIDEVRRFDRVRDIMPRLDFQSITFDTDSTFISPDQIDLLADIADIIHEMIERNPAEVILIEGHTDAPGSEIYNLALSDRRAEAVAIALTDYFGVPPENLVTQGYGESYLKIPTEASERENRRVAFRRITPLVSEYGR